MSCATPSCPYLRNTDISETNGTHCCRECVTQKPHGRFCHKQEMPGTLLFKPKAIAIKPNEAHTISPNAVGRSYFYANELASIYSFPIAPATNPPVVTVGVISLGGGLYGNVNSYGVLTGGDVQTYWTSIGIPVNRQPKVVVVCLNGATNSPASDAGSTAENTLDVEMIGGCYPSPNLTIIIYIAPNTINGFGAAISAASSPTSVNGRSYGTPKVISISWGLPEIYYSSAQLTTMNNIMAAAVTKGINICVATGDNGSNDGVGGSYSYADFPSSSPNCTAVGGTSLVCRNSTNTYNGSPAAIETAWTSGGGAVSAYFTKPTYQSGISAAARSTPDISSNADPNTGVAFLVKGIAVIYGGTSVAAPTVAAFLVATGISRFVNPILYAAPSTCLHDITVGTNGSYNCKVGYDNCTGLGTLNGSSITPYFLAYKPVSSLSLNTRSLTLNVGQTIYLIYTILPENASNKGVIWTTTNSFIASVSSAGLVTGIGVGTATITCISSDSSDITMTCTITVKSVEVTSVSISGSHIVQKGKTIQLTSNILPANATIKTVTWASSNPNVNVSRTGLVTGLKVGVANVVCTAANNASSLPFSITVTA